MEKVNDRPALESHSPAIPRLGAFDRAKAVGKSTAKRGIDVYFATKCALLRTFGIIDFPVPPNHCLRRTSSLTLRHYYESGVTTMMPIVTAARIFGVDLDQPVSVLDFGCGVARQFLQLNRNYPRVKAYACDAHPDNVAYVKSAFPEADVYANNFDPPLKYPDNTFDLVYSVSTFSHFSMDDARLWLKELSRVTKPGGLLCLTFNSFTSIAWTHERGGILDYSAEQLTRDGHWYYVDEASWYRRKAEEAVSEFGSNTTGATRPTGDMFFSPEYANVFVEDLGLKLEAIAPGVIDRMQDLAVIRKPKK
jgi:ubiquinone/menaquinone biosynthesis C-methylase UbiE